MARHVFPMFLDKLSSEVSSAKEAALKGLVAAVRAFSVPRVGAHLRSIGDAMFQEVRGGTERLDFFTVLVCFSPRDFFSRVGSRFCHARVVYSCV